jgi:hypothetical protein
VAGAWRDPAPPLSLTRRSDFEAGRVLRFDKADVVRHERPCVRAERKAEATCTASTLWSFGVSSCPVSRACQRPCTFRQLQTALDDVGDPAPATIYIAQITKGRDKASQAAVGGLQSNNEVFDFEEHGVSVLAP